jgi:hypothetical protein
MEIIPKWGQTERLVEKNLGLSTVGTKSRYSLLNWPGEGTEEAFFYRRKKQFSMKCPL